MKKFLHNKILALILVFTMVLSVQVSFTVSASSPAGTTPAKNVAIGKTVTVSSSKNANNYPASAITDNNIAAIASKWVSGTSGPHWAQVDFGVSKTIGSAAVYIENCSSFELQYLNGSTWTSIPGAQVTGNKSDFVALNFTSAVSTDKVRLYSTQSGSISIVELEVYESTNIALYKTVTASSTAGSYVASRAVDGKYEYNGSSWHSAADSKVDQWISVDLGKTYSLARVAAYVGYDTPGNASPTELKVQVSANNSSWTDVGSVTRAKSTMLNETFEFNNVSARYIRLVRPAGKTTSVGGFYVREFEVYLSGSSESTPLKNTPRGPMGRSCPNTPDYYTPATHTATASTLQSVLNSVANASGTVVIETTGLPSTLSGGNASRTSNILIRPALDKWLPDAAITLEASGVTLAGWNFTSLYHSYPSTGTWIWRSTIAKQTQLTVGGAHNGGLCEVVSLERGVNGDRLKFNPKDRKNEDTNVKNYQLIGLWLQGMDRDLSLIPAGGEYPHSDTIQFSSGWDCIVEDSVLYHSHGQALICQSDVGTVKNITITNNWFGVDRAAAADAEKRGDAISGKVSIAIDSISYTSNDSNVSVQINKGDTSTFTAFSGNVLGTGLDTMQTAFPNNLYNAGQYVMEEPPAPDLKTIWAQNTDPGTDPDDPDEPVDPYSGNCGANGDNVKWNFEPGTGVLNITGSGAMADYTSDSPWHKFNITSVKIASNVTSIGKCAFTDCTSLKNVTFGSGLKTIENDAFKGCSSLTDLDIPDGVTSIGSYAFSGCGSLESVKLGSGVQTIGEAAFSYDYSLAVIDISTDNSKFYSKNNCAIEKSTNKVIFGCKNSAIPEGVVTVGKYAFLGCSTVKFVQIPQSLKTVEYRAFYECPAIKDVYYSGTATQWRSVSIGAGHDYLAGVKFHYNSSPILTKKGDIDGDGIVTSIDALLALQHSIEKVSLKDIQVLFGDVNGKDSVNSSDALLILQYSIEMIDAFPVES